MGRSTQTPDLYSGVCHGGPLDGQTITVRCPAGFLVVKKTAGRCWLYDYADGGFTCREVTGRALVDDPAAGDNRWRAAAETAFDVVAL